MHNEVRSERANAAAYATNISEDTIYKICSYLKEREIDKQLSYFDLQSEKIMLFVSKSPYTGLYYVRFLPKETALHSIYLIRAYTSAIMALVVLIGTVLTLLGIKHSYYPIRSLADQIRTAYPKNQDIKNEILLIQQSFDDSFEQNLALSQKLASSKYGLIDHLLSTLIQGNFDSYESFQKNCMDLSVHLNKKYYAVCTILIENKDGLINSEHTYDFEKMLQVIMQSVSDCIQIQVKDLLFANRLILVISCDTNDNRFYCEVMESIQNRFFEEENILTSFGLGSFYDSFEKVGKSYLDSTNALDYRMVYGKKCLITPETYSNRFEKSQYPFDELDALYFALMTQNKEKVIEATTELSMYTKSSNCSLHTAKYICYDAFSVLKKALHTINSGYSDTLSKMLNITQLTNFDTIDEFFISFIGFVRDSINESDASSTKSSLSKATLEQQLIDYISTHCFSYSFQIDNVAKDFSITPQYMRKVFKDCTGRTISEYVANLKIEKAMQLLRESDKTLQEIVNEIGNTDVSGFIRLFKQKTGMTPGQYRKSF